MMDFKVGDRVKWGGVTRNYRNMEGTITRIGGDSIWCDDWTEGSKNGWVSKQYLVKIGEETMQSKYDELSSRIDALKDGWNKEADDVLWEIKKNHIIKIDRDCGNCAGCVYVALKRGYDETTNDKFSFSSQCEKMEAFKKALHWLLEHSDIRKDEKADKIKELRNKQDELQKQIEELKNEN